MAPVAPAPTIAPSATPAPGRSRRGELTRRRILDAAEALFAERGYEGTTLRDVAARVGLRNPSLYNHFDGKDSLYAAVLERGIRPVLEILSEFVDRQAPANSGEIVERVLPLLVRRPALPRLVQRETLSGGQRLTPMLREWIAPIFAKAHEATERRAGRWTPDQIPLLVLAMYHVVVGYFTIAPLYREINGEDLLTRESLARQTRFLVDLVDTLFTDIAPAEGDPR